MKGIKKKTISIILVAMVIISISLNCFAFAPGDISVTTDPTGSGEIKTLGGNLIGIFQVVGVVLAVLIVIVLGIKYMLGSAEEKSEYKKSMMPYLIGAALIFAGSVFANVVYEFFNGLNT